VVVGRPAPALRRDPRPAPGVLPDPVPVAVGLPADLDAARAPDVPVRGDVLPGAGLVEVGRADDVGVDVLAQSGVRLAADPTGDPAVERVGGLKPDDVVLGRLAALDVHLLAAPDRDLPAAGRDEGSPALDRDPRVAVVVDVDAVLPCALEGDGGIRRVDL